MVARPGEIDEPIEDVMPVILNSPVEGGSETNDDRGITPLSYPRSQPVIESAHCAPIHTQSRGLDGIQLCSGRKLPTSH